MGTMRLVFACFALTTGLSGCALFAPRPSLTPEECATVDWYQLGHVESARGSHSQLDAHTSACAPIGLDPDQTRYAQGYRDGLPLYCQPQTVMNRALLGRGSPDICPSDQQADLLPYHRAGMNVYAAESAVESLSSDRRWVDFQLKYLDQTEESRHDLMRQLWGLERSLDRAHSDRQAAEQMLIQYQHMLTR